MDLNIINRISPIDSTLNHLLNHTEELSNSIETIKHKEIFERLKKQIKKIDFRNLADLKNEKDNLSRKHLLICCIEELMKLAELNNWGMCKHLNKIYLFNGAYWSLISNSEMESFLGETAELMGVEKFDAKHYMFREQLLKQFLSISSLTKPEQKNNTVLVNMLNGTFEISPEFQQLRKPNRNDFLTYQLPFNYIPISTASLFNEFLNKVLPDTDLQKILAEYMGYIFIQPSFLKLEKALLLYGNGANGKSVFFDIVMALLGQGNISNFSLQSLTNEKGNSRAMLSNKLLNYGSEINGKLETAIFKQLVSGEPVEARHLYGDPFSITNYAKLIFNCNELPKDVEQTNAFFRRFLIIPFTITIPDHEQDKELSKKIISQELPGIFNWVLEGLKRLIEQKGFTKSIQADNQLIDYKKQSDNVQMFLEDEGFSRSTDESVEFKVVYQQYVQYCLESSYKKCSKNTFSKRVKNLGFESVKRNSGVELYLKKEFS